MNKMSDLMKKTVWIVSVVWWIWLWAITLKNSNKNDDIIKSTKNEIKQWICELVDCQNLNTKEEIFKNIENLEKNIKNKEILELISLIKSYISEKENLNDKDINFLKKSIIELENLDKVFSIFLDKKLTKPANIKISNLIKETQEKIKKWENFEWTSEKILEIMENDLNSLKDNNIFWKKSVRDFVEKNVSFENIEWKNNLKFYNWTTFETEEIDDFLNLFTIEYINIFWKNFGNKKDLNLSSEELDEIIWNILYKNKEKKFNFKVIFNTRWEKLTINLEKQKIFRNWIFFSNDEEIAKIQENYGLEHKNEDSKNRIENLLNSPKWQLFTKYETNQQVLEDKEKWIIVDTNDSENKYFSVNKNTSKTLTTPETLDFINKISEEFNKKTWKNLTINSFFKTKEDFEKTWANFKNSSLSFPGTFDLKISDLNDDERNILENILRSYDNKNHIIFINKWNYYQVLVLNWNQTLNKKFENYSHIQENFEKIKISEYLKIKKIDNWLDFSTKVILQDIFYKAQIDYMKFSTEQRIKIQENLINFINFIVYIESSWWEYLENYKGSTAKWPFQVLDWYKNWVRDKKYLWENNFSSFEVWLRTYMKYANNSIYPSENAAWNPEWVSKAYISKWKISPNDLTHEQNINAFLVWTFLGDNNENSDSLMKVLLNWNFGSAKELYEKHHTNPDEATQNKIEEAEKIFKDKFSKI